MRTIIELPEETVAELAKLAEKEQKSRAALIREAIAVYLVGKKVDEMSATFGLWADDPVDALEYEQSLRQEWEDS